VRSNVEGTLEDLDVPMGEPPDGAPRHYGTFSLVIDDSSSRIRALPSAYLGPAQIFADREVRKTKKMLTRSIGAVLTAQKTPVYLITACRIGDKIGLYTKDIFNRSVFRRRATRLGLEFAPDPFVQMTEGGHFRAEGLNEFRPDFILVNRLATVGASPSGVVALSDDNVNRGGFLTFLFGILRIGTVGVRELGTLARTIQQVPIVSEATPEAALESIHRL
jgi:hypothetical protein